MVILVQNTEEYNNDIRTMIMAFYPGVKIKSYTPAEIADMPSMLLRGPGLIVTALFDEKRTVIKLEEDCKVRFTVYIDGDYRDKKKFRNKFKMGIYKLLCEYTGKELPWGDLTGVRPTKIAMAALEDGVSEDKMVEMYQRVYAVSESKAKLATSVAAYERKLINTVDLKNDYCLYVGIPFCPSRCLYCSFTSYPIAMYKDSVSDYIDAVAKELQYVAYMYRNKRLISIYVGGGTPTAPSAEMIDKLLSIINDYFDLSYLREYTVESGRPDSITEDKLKVMKERGVTRISINPQTMNDKTLKIIGRAHNEEQTEKAFLMARKAGFDNINMDIIAGLPGETIEDLRYTLNKIAVLAPESLTVHSLAIKRAANLKEQIDTYQDMINKDTDLMLEEVAKYATKAGLLPYYMYRQKNIAGNLENVGYSKPGLECEYNILIMEEKTDIIACGAGASTKLVYHDENRVERVENVKNVDEYIMRIEEMLDRKRKMLVTKY